MVAPMIEHRPMYTEGDYFAFGESNERVELFDGSLLVNPAPTFRHQKLSRRLANALEPAANEAGLDVFEAVNVRLKPGRIPIPDIVIMRPVDEDGLVAEVRDVALVCEITSMNVAADKITKMHYYAVAGIPWYLIVDPDGPRLTLYRLDDDKYVEEAGAEPGTPLLFTDPIATELDPASLNG